MKKFTYLREPGYIYDLIFIFFWKYNKERFFDIFSIEAPEDRDFYTKTLSPLEPASNELSIFFRATEDKRCFFPRAFFHPYQADFSKNYSLPFLLEKLSLEKTVLRRMIRYYCYHLSEEEIAACVESPARLFAEIKRTSLSDSQKKELYEFFIDPRPYLDLLCEELSQVSQKLEGYYQEHEAKLQAIAERFTPEDFLEQCRMLHDRNIDFSDYGETTYLSLCLLNKHLIFSQRNDDSSFFLLGVDYEESLQRLLQRPYSVKLEEFGTALSDENRVRMLNLLQSNGELSCKEIASHFPFSDSTTYHHLSIMLRCGILRTRFQGKNILYSVNRPYFQSVIDFLQTYSKQ